METIEGEFVEEGRALAVPVEVDAGALALPAVTPAEAKAAMAQYLELCEAVLSNDDYQEFTQKKRVQINGRWESVSEVKRFKKKSAVKKLQTFFGVEVTVRSADRDEMGEGHYGFRVIASARARNGRVVEATGACSTTEERFDITPFRDESEAAFEGRKKKALARAYHDILSTAETRATNRAVMNCIGVGGGEVTADEVSRDRAPSAPPAAPKRYPQAAPTSAPPPRKGEPPIEPIASADEAEADAVKLGVSAIRALCQKHLLSVPQTDGLDRGQLVVIFKELQAKVRARVAAGPTDSAGVPIAARSVPSEAPAPATGGSAPQDVPGGFPPVHVAAGGPAPVQAPQPKPVLDTPEIRERAKKALHAFCSGEKVPEDIRHQISYVMHGHSSSNDLDTSQLRSLRDKCAHWVTEKRPVLATWEGLA